MGWKVWAVMGLKGAAGVVGAAVAAAAKPVVAPVVVVAVVVVAIVKGDTIVDAAEKVVTTVAKAGKKVAEGAERVGRAVAREVVERTDRLHQTATSAAAAGRAVPPTPAAPPPVPIPPPVPTPPMPMPVVAEPPPMPPVAPPVLAPLADAPAAMAEQAATAWSSLNPSTWTRGQQVVAAGIAIGAIAACAWKFEKRRRERAAQMATGAECEATPLVDPVRPAASTSRPNSQDEPRSPDALPQFRPDDESLINREHSSTEEVMDPGFFMGYLQARTASNSPASGQPSKRDQTPNDRSTKRQKTSGAAASGAPEPPDRDNGQDHTEEDQEDEEEEEEDKENSEKKAANKKKKITCMVWNSGGINRNWGYQYSIDDVIEIDHPDIIILNENKSDENLAKFAAKHGYKFEFIGSPRPRTRGTAILYRPDAGFTVGPALRRFGRAGGDDHAIEAVAVEVRFATGFRFRLVGTYVRGFDEHLDEALAMYTFKQDASEDGIPTVIAGDLNMRKANLADTWSENGLHDCLDRSWATNRYRDRNSADGVSRSAIDYVMTNDPSAVLAHRPIEPDMTATDDQPTPNVHYPIIFEIGDGGKGGPCADPDCKICRDRQ